MVGVGKREAVLLCLWIITNLLSITLAMDPMTSSLKVAKPQTKMRVKATVKSGSNIVEV